MMGLPLGFAQPLVLLGLLSLPVLWWILRLIPPRPRRVTFPPTRLLFDIKPKEDTPARTPWWLTLLRLLLATLVILAAAGPLWNPPVATSTGATPIALLIDDGFGAAASWDLRLRTADDIVARAEADNRGVAIVPLGEASREISLQTPAAARVRLKQLKPVPYAVERSDALPTISRLLTGSPDMEVIWLSDGVDIGRGSEFVSGLARATQGRTVSVVTGGLPTAHALAAADNAAGALTVKVLRATTGGTEDGVIRALDLKGLPLGETRFAFKDDDRETDAEINLPVEIRNDIARLEIAGERSAGAVQLLDKRWRRRTVGIVSGSTADTAQPLLASTYYLARALNPFADVRLAEVAAPAEAVRRFIEQNVPMIMLADVGNVSGETHDRLASWIEDGGMLVRFAGPRLAASDDDLVPVKLRRGGRTLGGSLSWDQPQPLAAFSKEGPFGNMTVPKDVNVTRQVLAEPEAGLADRTWASLGDGTPLVTAEKRGKGMIVLFHVTADTRWSDLPLSGSFVEMLRRMVGLAGTTTSRDEIGQGHRARGGAADPHPRRLRRIRPADRDDAAGRSRIRCARHRRQSAGLLRPARGPARGQHARSRRPSGRARLRAPARTARGLSDRRAAGLPRPGAARGARPARARRAGGVPAGGRHVADFPQAAATGGRGAGAGRRHRRTDIRRDRPSHRTPCSGSNSSGRRRGRQAHRPPIRRCSADLDFALKATIETRLAYVVTGDAEVDGISKSGLQGLTLFLAQRTALEAGEPVGLDIARDELAFFPLIYWPVVPGAAKPSPAALARIDAYMKNGGTVLFDTRDAIMAPPGPGGANRSPGMLALRNILASLDVPELEPVSRDHVLTKTFFLLRDFPGRFNSGQLWVEALPTADEQADESKRPARAGDGVSSIIISSNDFAGAWATRNDGQAMLPMVPGEPRQREFAFRAGVNIVMYTLTGNYKADQVHVPALLERLGQ